MLCTSWIRMYFSSLLIILRKIKERIQKKCQIKSSSQKYTISDLAPSAMLASLFCISMPKSMASSRRILTYDWKVLSNSKCRTVSASWKCRYLKTTYWIRLSRILRHSIKLKFRRIKGLTGVSRALYSWVPRCTLLTRRSKSRRLPR